MKKLPDAELELMMIIWNIGESVTRIQIEERLNPERNIVPSTILTLLSRLTERRFLEINKKGKVNYYTPLVSKEDYQRNTGKTFLQKVFDNSIASFTAAMYDGGEIGEEELKELKRYIEKKLADK